MTWKWLHSGKLMKEKESLLIATQNNAIRSTSVQARINTRDWQVLTMWRDRDKTINLMMTECSKLAQKEYTSRHDGV